MTWPTKKLGEIAPFLRGAGLSKKELSPTGTNKCILYGQLYTTYGPVINEIKSKTNKNGSVVSVAGDVLIPGTTTADEIGIAVASALNEDGIIIGGDINIIRTENKILNSKFLAYLLSGPYKMQMAKYARGTNIIHLSGKDIAKIEVPILPSQIQKQIVERLDKIAEAQKLNDKLIQKTDELFQSLLAKEFISNQKDWEIKKLETLIDNIKIGPFGSALKIAELLESGPVRVLFIENIVNNKFDWTKEKYISAEKYKELVAYTVTSGDILITMMGTIGRTSITPENIGKAIISSHLIKISPNKKITISEFINFALHCPFVKDQIRRKAKGAIMKGLNSKILRNLYIPIPKIEIQRQIVAKLFAVQEYKKQLLEQKSRLKELFDSALAKSMK